MKTSHVSCHAWLAQSKVKPRQLCQLCQVSFGKIQIGIKTIGMMIGLATSQALGTAVGMTIGGARQTIGQQKPWKAQAHLHGRKLRSSSSHSCMFQLLSCQQFQKQEPAKVATVATVALCVAPSSTMQQIAPSTGLSKLEATVMDLQDSLLRPSTGMQEASQEARAKAKAKGKLRKGYLREVSGHVKDAQYLNMAEESAHAISSALPQHLRLHFRLLTSISHQVSWDPPPVGTLHRLRLHVLGCPSPLWTLHREQARHWRTVAMLFIAFQL